MDSEILIKYTIAGIMPLFMVSVLGACLTLKGIWDKQTVDCVAKAYSNFFNPIFVFFNVIGAIRLSEIQDIWPLLVSPFLFIFVGILVSFFHSLCFRKIKKFARVIKCVLVFSNIGNLPVILMKGICSPYGPLKGNDYCKNSNSYISLQLLTYNAIIWSYGWSLVSKDKQNHPLLNSNPVPAHLKVSMWKSILKNLTLPGPVSCMLALIFSLIPGIQSTFYNPSSLLYCISQAGLQISIAGVILGQTSLGANLVLLKTDKLDLSKTYLFSIIIFKNLIMPLIGLVITFSLWKLYVFKDNIVMAYIIYISFCTPTAFIILLICQNLQYGTKEVAWLMLAVYSFAIPTLVIFTYVFFVLFSVD